jgi:pimeloyl-ACP methyl ester carboxylesterase
MPSAFISLPRRGFVRTLLAAGTAVAAFPAYLFFSQERLLFFPQPLAAGGPRLAPGVEEVELAADDGTRLHGWFARPVDAAARAPLVIYFGGNAEEVSWMLDWAPRMPGHALLAINYRGYGRSEGRPGERELFADALAVHRYALSRPDVDPESIHAFGRSLGSGVAVHLAAERTLAGVVLVTPFDSIVAVAQSLYPFLPVRLMLRHPFDSLARAPSIRAPLLTIAAGRDRVVPPAHAARLHAAWGGPKHWRELADATHDDVVRHAAFWPEVRAFLAAPGRAGTR